MKLNSSRYALNSSDHFLLSAIKSAQSAKYELLEMFTYMYVLIRIQETMISKNTHFYIPNYTWH